MFMLNKFVENFNYLIAEKEITGKELAKVLNINEAAISYYRNGVNTPSVSNLIKIADYFNCSIDFLLGLTDGEASNQKYKMCIPIQERIAELPKLFGLNANKFCREVKISESAYYDWKKGDNQPNIYSIIKIAKHFDRSVDFILGRES